MNRRNPCSVNRGLAALILLLTVWLASGPAPALSQEKVQPQMPRDASEIPPGANRYTVLFGGNPVGVHGAWKTGKNVWNYHYEFNERGRGPWLDESVTLNEKGIPISLHSKGHDYYEAPFEDSFSITRDKAVWKNAAEQGEKSRPGDAFYLSMPVVAEQASAVPEELAVLARALLATPGNRLTLLPTGEAQIARVGEFQAKSNNQTQKVIQYQLLGLDFAPTPIWLEEDGTLFAILGDFLSLIRQGWESSVPELSESQRKSVGDRDAKLARELAHKPASPTVFQHVNLFDSETATVRPNTTVVVSGNHIQAVGADGHVAITDSSEIIDARGKTLLPGLWDMHVHMGEGEGLMHISVGVTTVRDLGNKIEDAVEFRHNFDQGTAIGPRMILAGMVDGRGPYHSQLSVPVDSEQEARDAVEQFQKLGYAQIKVYGSLKPSLVPVIAREAHSRGMRVSGHVPVSMTAEDCVRDGFDELNHTYFLFINFMDDLKSIEGTGRYSPIPERAAQLDLDSEKVKTFVQLLKERGTVVDPTVAIFQTLYVSRKGTMNPALATMADRLPSAVRRSALQGGMAVPTGMDQRFRDSFQAFLRMVSKLYQTGIPIVAGTDQSPLSYTHELELYVQAGVPPSKVLQLATIGSARIMKKDSELGSIAIGKLADMILVNGNPAIRIDQIRNIDTVMKDGVIYNVAELDKAIGISPIKSTEKKSSK